MRGVMCLCYNKLVARSFSLVIITICLTACATKQTISVSNISPSDVDQLSTLVAGNKLIVETNSGEEIRFILSSFSESELFGNVYSGSHPTYPNLYFLETDIKLDPSAIQSIDLSKIENIRAYNLTREIEIADDTSDDVKEFGAGVAVGAAALGLCLITYMQVCVLP